MLIVIQLLFQVMLQEQRLLVEDRLQQVIKLMWDLLHLLMDMVGALQHGD